MVKQQKLLNDRTTVKVDSEVKVVMHIEEEEEENRSESSAEGGILEVT